MRRILFIFVLFSIFLNYSCKKNNIQIYDNIKDLDYTSNDQIHLRKKNNIDFYLNKEANLLTEVVVREIFQKWGELTHFNFSYKGRNKAGLRRDGKNTVSFLIKWPKQIPINKVGWCQNWYDKNGNIIETDIIFNMLVTKFTTLKTNSPNSYYIEGVLAHEIGHMIGLGHLDMNYSIMKQKSSPEESFFKGNIDEETILAYKKLYKITE